MGEILLGLLFGLVLLAMTVYLLRGQDAGDVHGTTTTTHAGNPPE